MNKGQANQLNLLKLKRLITTGIQSIPIDRKHKSAMMVIGDTGVGKTTILSFLAKRKLYIKIHGLNTILDSEDDDGLKIGHDRFSETRVPTKILIDNMVFFDCSGFKDNRGEQFEISNSFFVQRLFNIYEKIKILLIVDESSISQARADKLPKLIRNLLNSFDNLQDIQDGVILLINRAKPEFSQKVYCDQLLKMAKLKGEQGNLFNREQQAFIEFLVKNKRVSLFKQAKKEDEGQLLEVKQENLFNLIRDTNYVKSKKIKNIISESAKLSIRQYIDRLALDAEEKIKIFVHNVIKEFTYESKVQYGSGLDASMNLKKKALSLNSSIQNAPLEELTNIILQNTNSDMTNLEQGISTVIFFQGIYNKADFYVKLLKSTISAEITKLLVSVDDQINRLQEEQRKFNQLQNQLEKESKKAEYLEKNLTTAQQQNRKQAQSIEKIKETYQKQIASLKQKHQEEKKLCAAQEKQTFAEYKRQIDQLKKQMALNENQKNEFKAMINAMKDEIQGQIEQLQLVNIENLSLKRQMEHMANEIEKNSQMNQSFVSKTSKTSKYPEVVCPHFKNGGKCVHCIKAWKAEQKSKKKLQQEMKNLSL